MIDIPSRLWLVLLLGLSSFTLSPATIAGAESEKPQGSPLPRWRDNSEMVFARGGEFVRAGGHKVRVRSFYMDKYEVTNEQYCGFLNDSHARHFNHKQEIEKQGDRFVPKCCKERWPVYAVNWDDAVAYARWAGKRLPTEAEFEWAAAGNRRRVYPWGDDPITPSRANFGGQVGHPQPVGSHPAGRTPTGIHDLSGNVAEWCSDWFAEGYYSRAPEHSPEGPEQGQRRVRRGGCWAMAAEHQTTTARGSSRPDYRPVCIGFRCVRPARRVLVLLGENFEEIELAGYTGALSWAAHTTKAGNYIIPKGEPVAEVPAIEVVVAGFAPEVYGMGGMNIRPHVLVTDLSDEDVDRFDAVAIPACVGSGRGQHTWMGAADLESDRAVAMEAACLLVRELVSEAEYRSFRNYNPWLFGEEGQYPPRMESLK